MIGQEWKPGNYNDEFFRYRYAFAAPLRSLLTRQRPESRETWVSGALRDLAHRLGIQSLVAGSAVIVSGCSGSDAAGSGGGVLHFSEQWRSHAAA